MTLHRISLYVVYVACALAVLRYPSTMMSVVVVSTMLFLLIATTVIALTGPRRGKEGLLGFCVASTFYFFAVWSASPPNGREFLITEVLFRVCEPYLPSHDLQLPLPPIVGAVDESLYITDDLWVIWHAIWVGVAGELGWHVARGYARWNKGRE